ncbi:MAG TPA: 2-oxoglutarate dehydrogenase E1 component [Candidatus Limnocylindria bacterium]|nr:2-oxoglutarate dehydrogenase E1 component [Candidatus Limnocylindria bacterium]
MDGIDALAVANRDYVEELYRRYTERPDAVDSAWAAMFRLLEQAPEAGNGGWPARTGRTRRDAGPAFGVFDLVHSYRELGHLVAHLNPLEPPPPLHPLLEPAEFGFGPADMNRVVDSGSLVGCDTLPLRELIERLQATYCRTIGVEYLHIQDKDQRRWLQERMEPSLNRPVLTPEERLLVLQNLIFAEGFEQFLQHRYPTAKRFSLEGGESLIPLLEVLIEEGAAAGIEEMVLGMAHRGRLNVLVNVLRKPYEMVLAEFEGALLARDAQGDGDVKYHLGYSRDHVTRHGARIHLSLSSNPSHLEAINPVIEGMVRAKQDRVHDVQRRRVAPVLIHGDAAFTGQGVVAETLWLSELAHYRTGGTVHVIINNQIGFTTEPKDYRFTPYPSDVAKIIQAPVFHVNGNDPEAAVQAARLAAAYRQTFGKDAIIDLVCYRKHGHNELDDASFTQPVMVAKIQAHPSPLTEYRDRLIRDGVLTREEYDRRAAEFQELLVDAQAYARDFMPRQQVFVFGGAWKGLGWAGDDWHARTAVPKETLVDIAGTFTRIPEGFSPHPRLRKLMEQRAAMVTDGGVVDWGCAEALAIGSLLLEGTPVRLSGQDTQRGTFSHRHAVWHDVRTGAVHVPLDHIRDGQAHFEVIDSMLSEYACLGFEFGYSWADPWTLVVWEAQFGDFANGAQIVIDQFISSSESKWQRMSGLVMLLPHGYEGQGPEHSSARLERYLQLCAENNMQVCNLTTPAQYFHVLRRQMRRSFRKPLVIMSPKSLLRHKLAVSPLAALTDGEFATVLDDVAVTGALEAGVTVAPERVSRVLVCSGKVYYALLAARREQLRDTVAIVRVEQLYPFPFSELAAVLARYPNATQVWWVQEEPRNMGAWQFVEPLLRRTLPAGIEPRYVGRDEAASPATGSFKLHQAEEMEVLNAALAR